MIFRIFTLLEKIFNEKGVADIVYEKSSMMNTDTVPMSFMQKPTITTFLIIFFFILLFSNVTKNDTFFFYVIACNQSAGTHILYFFDKIKIHLKSFCSCQMCNSFKFKMIFFSFQNHMEHLNMKYVAHL